MDVILLITNRALQRKIQRKHTYSTAVINYCITADFILFVLSTGTNENGSVNMIVIIVKNKISCEHKNY